jgi:mono/diheme cytochrome c family protein
MPAFGATHSDAEIAAAVNYVTGRFGAKASQLTEADIANLRKQTSE